MNNPQGTCPAQYDLTSSLFIIINRTVTSIYSDYSELSLILLEEHPGNVTFSISLQIYAASKITCMHVVMDPA